MSPEQSHLRPFEIPLASEHAALTKRFGEVYPDTLLSLASRAEEALEVPSSHEHTTLERIKYHEIAADAYLEAAIITHDETHTSDDLRLGLIDTALEHYQSSISLREDRIAIGYDNPDDITDMVRMQLRLNFEHIYKDIVCGEVSEQTRQEVKILLEEELRSTSKLKKSIHRGITKGYYPPSYQKYLKDLSGLWAELTYLQAVWIDSEHSSSVAFLATTRADNGNTGVAHKLSKDTHDIVIATQRDQAWVFTPIEVKRSSSTSKTALHHLGRYSAQLAYISRSGAVTTPSPISASSPHAS